MRERLEEFAAASEARPYRVSGFYTYVMETPAHRFVTYFGPATDSVIAFTRLRGDVSDDDVYDFFMPAVEALRSDVSGDSLHRAPFEHPRFDALLYVPPSHHRHLQGEADDLHSYIVGCYPIYDCEFSGEESPSLYAEVQRYGPLIDIARSPAPQCSVRCNIPGAQIDIPDWYQCVFSELLSYLRVLGDHRAGSFAIRDVHGATLELDPSLPFEENSVLAHRHGLASTKPVEPTGTSRFP